MSKAVVMLMVSYWAFTGTQVSPGLTPPTIEAVRPLPVLMCFEDEDCAEDEYCLKPFGHCDEWGQCVERLPDEVQCFAVWDPVCGCDGQTYSNGCYAAKAGVSIDYAGECVEGCFDDDDCPADQFCATPLGHCDGPGECIDRLGNEVQCFAVWDPVCGCDGQTYSNGCYAAKAGVSIAYLGECVEACVENEHCPWDEYCLKPLGACDGPGECVDRLPDWIGCVDVWDPVCGCDGQTYSNACYAHKAAVSIDYPGECLEACLESSDCPVDRYCGKPTGDCDGPGECVPFPDLCHDIWMPVCGCDGVTYSNGCYAHREGVNVAHDGECPGGCFVSEDCAPEEYCLTPPAACDGPGECVERPGDDVQCLDIWDPVCGCDGQTYSNPCYAAKAGVSVDYEGECWY